MREPCGPRPKPQHPAPSPQGPWGSRAQRISLAVPRAPKPACGAMAAALPSKPGCKPFRCLCLVMCASASALHLLLLLLLIGRLPSPPAGCCRYPADRNCPLPLLLQLLQVSCCLCLLNLLLLLLNPALADGQRQLDFQVKNMDVMKRQVGGRRDRLEFACGGVDWPWDQVGRLVIQGGVHRLSRRFYWLVAHDEALAW